MARVKTFSSSCGVSMDIKGTWHKFSCGIEIELDEGDDVAKVKQMAHDTVAIEVEKQIQATLDAYNDTAERAHVITVQPE